MRKMFNEVAGRVSHVVNQPLFQGVAFFLMTAELVSALSDKAGYSEDLDLVTAYHQACLEIIWRCATGSMSGYSSDNYLRLIASNPMAGIAHNLTCAFVFSKEQLAAGKAEFFVKSGLSLESKEWSCFPGLGSK